MKIPTSRGEDAMLWLEANGLPSRPGNIRASDYECAALDPFHYYLTVRLGLTDPLRASKALSHGSWYHKALELPLSDGHVVPVYSYREAVNERLSELATAADTRGLPADLTNDILSKERRFADEALIWADAAHQVKVAGKTLFEHTGHLRSLGREIFVSLDWPQVDSPVVCRFDELMLDDVKGELWVVDDKTTALPASRRMWACPFEFQTHLYALAAQLTLRQGYLAGKADTVRHKFAGVVHRVLQKPGITFGQNDRPCRVYSHELKSGPRKGQSEVRKEYSGDPDPIIYLRRVREWFDGTGDFLHEAEARKLDPPINVSWTRFNHDPTCIGPEFRRQLSLIGWYSACPAHPENFPRSTQNILDPTQKGLYAPFYTSPVRMWPDIVKELGLIQHWRDLPVPSGGVS